MEKILFSIMLLLLLIIRTTPIEAITWGEPDSKHSNVGAMVVYDPDYGYLKYCSGTLIHPRIFLTAGHCTYDLGTYGLEADDVRVNFNNNALNISTLREVEEVITHPNYYWGPQSNPYDVGVLILKIEEPSIPVATLPSEGFLDELKKEGELNQGKNKAKFTVVGYGGMLEWPPPQIVSNNERQYAISEYRGLLQAWLILSQNQATSDGGTCYGDSGGPVFWINQDETEVLVGIVSWGDTPCVSSGFNYRVDIPETLDFIQSVINSIE